MRDLTTSKMSIKLLKLGIMWWVCWVCVHVPHTCEDPHSSVHGINVPADQHLHEQRKQLWPRLGPVPVSDGWDGVCNAGADLADGLPQSTRQQLSNGSFSLNGEDGGLIFRAKICACGQIKPDGPTWSVVSGGLNFSDWEHQWVSTYCFRMTDASCKHEF